MGDKPDAKRKRPLGVTLIALLQIISGLQLLLVALIAFAIAAVASTPRSRRISPHLSGSDSRTASQ